MAYIIKIHHAFLFGRYVALVGTSFNYMHKYLKDAFRLLPRQAIYRPTIARPIVILTVEYEKIRRMSNPSFLPRNHS